MWLQSKRARYSIYILELQTHSQPLLCHCFECLSFLGNLKQSPAESIFLRSSLSSLVPEPDWQRVG